MPTPTISTLPTSSTVFTVHPDIDGHSVWTFDYFGKGIKKIDLNTSVATLSYTFPYSSNPAVMEDGTVIFWQDSTGKVYLFNQIVSGTASNTIQKLDPSASMASVGSITLASGVLAGPPEDWVVYQSGGQDFVATITNSNSASKATWTIINLTTMTLVGNGVLTTYQAAGNNEKGYSVFKDATGNIWFVTTTLTSSTIVTPHFYKSVSNGTPVGQFTIPGNTTNFSNPSFAAFCSYYSASDSVFFGDAANVTGSGGASGDMSMISLGTQAVTPVVKNASPFTKFYSGTFDVTWSCMRMGFASTLPSGTATTAICVPGDVANAGATQRGGVANFFDPATLTLQESYNITQLLKNAGYTLPTISDAVRGTVTAPHGMLLWLPSTNRFVVTYEAVGSPVYVLDYTPATPDLSVAPASLSFTAQQGGSNPATQSLAVSNVGLGTLTFTDTSDSGWLSALPSSGTAPQSLTVSVNITGLTPGSYTGHITVTSAGSLHSPTSIPVTLTVTNPPNLSVAPTSLSFSGRLANPPAAQMLTVSNTTAGVLTFTVSDDAAWLSVNPTSGTATQALTVSVDLTGLSAGTYLGHITVTAPSPDTGSPQVVPVTLVVIPGPIAVPFTFLDPSGAPLAGGKVVVYLSMDIALNASQGQQVMAKRLEVTLDSNGHVVLYLWPNNGLQPPGTVYFVEARSALGQPAWSGQITVG